MNPAVEPALQKAADLFARARHAVAFTGAGFSTPSGIPDFRSQSTGLWTRFDPMQVASLSAFRQRPEAFFNWLRPLVSAISAAQPNPAHHALAELEKRGLLRAVITQNIDGLHQKAGSQTVIEVHGSLNQWDCPSCRAAFTADESLGDFPSDGPPPRCPRCDGPLKPGIVLYEEMLPEKAWQAAESACRRADLLLIAGTSLEVAPASYLPSYALENRARLILVNLSPTPLDPQADVCLSMDVAQALPALVEQLA